MRLSYGLAPVYRADESVQLIQAADELGMHGCYLGDDFSLQDPWVLAGAAARETARVRLGFSVTHIFVRQPTLIAQGLATLDQLSGGRVEAGLGLGGVDMLDAHHIQWRGSRPIARLREAFGVIRQLLDEGELDHQGEFFRYSGLQMGIRPVQHHVPLSVGAMVGPGSFELAGEVADGVHAAGCSRVYTDYVVEHVTKGAHRAGREPTELDLATFAVTAIAEESAAAKDAARAILAGWMAQFPRKLIVRHGFNPEVIDPIVAAMRDGDVKNALRQTPDDLVDALSVAGTPEECVDKIRRDLIEAGISHLIMGVTDPGLVAEVAGAQIGQVPGVQGQLQLIRDRVMPALAVAQPGSLDR